jgi:3,5-dioxohexanoate:acetyl-CoA acetone transferase
LCSPIVHLHARNPETGKPDQRPEAFLPILQLVKKRSDCIVNLTTGGAPYMKVEERVRPAALFKPELASLTQYGINELRSFPNILPSWKLR